MFSTACILLLFVLLTSPKPVSAVPVTQQNQGALDFLILGDWGNPDGNDQRQAANAMMNVAARTNPQFVVSVGDNFYDAETNPALAYEGVRDVNDPKWDLLWKHMYGGKLSQIPWYVVQGNHDWRANQQAQIEYSKKERNWVNPDYFWEKVIPLPNGGSGYGKPGAYGGASLPSGKFSSNAQFGLSSNRKQEAAFIFVDTQLIAYGYEPTEQEEPGMTANFRNMGWTPNSQVIESQIKWIEDALERHKDKPYVFVVGHHPLAVCNGEGQMGRLLPIFQKYRITGYLFGHVHAMQHTRVENTFYVESGAGGKMSNMCHDGPYIGGSWGASGMNGFARGIVDRDGFTVEYYDQDATLLYKSEKLGPRF
ncbi:hypothetical protein HK102_009855 [Quaeritorhiza haematococci]|nr:hypothetical protein HK102_009855 [Quaeritorhiza haematococci]